MTGRANDARAPVTRAIAWMRPRRDRLLAIAIGTVTVVAFVVLHATGDAVANYDARSHLVVARRIFDSATPGWLQHGVLWLPLPHVLALPLVATDWLYRTGLGVSLLSLAAGLLATFHVWRLARRLFANDDLAVALATAALGLNPNVVYASATPLVEPLFLYFVCAAADALATWQATPPDDARPRLRALAAAGALLAAGCATRYEAWPLLAGATLWVFLAAPGSLRARARPAALLGALGALGAAAVLLHTWYIAGDPLAFRALAGGENPARGIWQIAAWAWGRGLFYYTGVPLSLLFMAAAADLVRAGKARPPAAGVALLLLVPALVPALFYFSGHLFRFRYSLLAAPAVAIFCGWAALRQPRLALAALALHLGWLAVPVWPWYRSVLHLESTWHEVAEPERAVAAAFLRYAHDGRPVLASMGSLAPLLWESAIPLALVVHEGNGPVRDPALARPRDVVGWIVLERGDEFARVAAARPDHFFDGFVRVFAEGTIEIWKATGM